MDREVLELYSDYLLSSFGPTTATGLAALLGEGLSHDRIRRFLRAQTFTSADLWHLVKPLVRSVQQEDAVLIIDDSIQPKPYTDESELICWHWDHKEGRNVKGINLLSALYYTGEAALPVACELVTKPDIVIDPKTERPKREARVTKNELYRKMLAACHQNGLPFRYVLNDVWYAAAENMRFVKETLSREFVMPLKANRKVALSEADKAQGRYVPISSVELQENTTCLLWLEGVPFALRFTKQVFTNEDGSHDGSQGVLYLVTSDTDLTAEQMQTIYQKRWKVEEFHKSLKGNASLAKSPTRTVRTQTNHVFASLYALVKLERLRWATKLHHFALKTKLYKAALASAFQQLQSIKADCLPA